jgi:serine/threonine protein phosphatase PrpC
VSDVLVAQKGRLYVVSDGIGGHQAGDVASKIAVETMQRVYYEDPGAAPDVALRRAVEAANDAIYRRAQDPSYADMGATIVAVVIRGDELTIAHVGDSRVYLLRQGQLQRLTDDHSWVAEQVRSGALTATEAANHDMRHVVTRSLGNNPTVDVEVRQFVLHDGDRLLLCSDGVWELVPDEEMRRVLRQGVPRGAARTLVDRAVAAGAPDDATALVVSVGGPRSGVLAQVEKAVAALVATPAGRTGVVLASAFVIVALLFAGAMSIFRPAEVTPTAVSFSPTETATPVPNVEPTESLPSPTTAVVEPTATSVPGEEMVDATPSASEGCRQVPVENGDFELNEDGDRIPDGWDTNGFVELIPYQESSGHFVRLGSGGYNSVFQWINVPQGSRVIVRFRFRSQAASDDHYISFKRRRSYGGLERLYLEEFGAESTTWESREFSISNPAVLGRETLLIIGTLGNNRLLVDDVYLEVCNSALLGE